MCLAPQLNLDRDGKWEDGPKYDVLVNEMMRITSSFNSTFKDWRAEVKKGLFI